MDKPGAKKASLGKKVLSGASKTSFAMLKDKENNESCNVQIERSTDDGHQSDKYNDDAVINSSKEKKKKKLSQLSNKSDVLDDDVGLADEKEVDECSEMICLVRKKLQTCSKSLKDSGSFFSDVFLDEENEEAEVYSEVHCGSELAYDGTDSSLIPAENKVLATFSGKKKSSKMKGSTAFLAAADDNDDSEFKCSKTNGLEQNATAVVAKHSKNKKNKRSGTTIQKEEDLDKILAELGEAPATSKPTPTPFPPIDEKADTQPEPSGSSELLGAEQYGLAERAAAKKNKNKKKKEKEKEKKAAVAASAENVEEETGIMKIGTTSKGGGKKVPKHIREIQEAIARRKEAEERKKREEEERSRREEEECRRQEELERQAEEAKRKKKEREKEKNLKKKQEHKQKEEQHRLEVIRNQLLNINNGTSLPVVETDAPKKRPIYTKKKSKLHHGQSNGARTQNIEEKEKWGAEQDVDSFQTEKVEVVDIDKAEAADVTKENGLLRDGVDDEDWDAKSWDDTSVTLLAKTRFEDEKDDSVGSLAVKNQVTKTSYSPINDTSPSHADAEPPAEKLISTKLNKSGAPDCKQRYFEGDAAGKKKTEEVEIIKETASSDNHFEQSEGNLRSPICCILGHVDAGKTKLLDYIRGTDVQKGEARGITQQIGATYFPVENIRDRTKELKADAKLIVPGLLVFDTPGHESFANLRSRGSGLCDIAILVVDIMHGLKPQTIESLELLKMKNSEFIVALNKVDLLYGWKACYNSPIKMAMKQQSKMVQNEFEIRLNEIILQFKEQGVNTELYYRNKEMGETFNIVPTSSKSGEGIPDLLLLLVQRAQRTMVQKLTFSNKVQCTVLEVKIVEGHGTTIDVVLVNGVLHEGDQIVVCGMQELIVTTIRALLTPHPMKELRVKGTYQRAKEIKAAQGVKIVAQGLEHAVAGTSLYVVGPDDDLEEIKYLAREDMNSVLERIDKSGEGVCVQASTLGSLEAILEYLKSPAVNIPVSHISIGPVHKKDVRKANAMLEKKREYATILVFDVKVMPEAQEYADEVGVKIFVTDVIYHLFDKFKAHIDNIKEERRRETAAEAVFPCKLEIVPNFIFNKKDPIVLGVKVLEGIAKVGTPICIHSEQQQIIDIGRIASIKNSDKFVAIARKDEQVAIKIVSSTPEERQKMYGRHFDFKDRLLSHISRRSIDVLKENFRNDLTIDDWKLVRELKKLFGIP